ncbi:unnamed protein product [Staurois parvus]|uniref:Uncharacterized protein n=1 Tax=Staurois parvus TaxID=386267 RepID=A0ABN9ECE6_9NEOB|nr:unnamed protein product [Staurois parvus]
MTLAGLSLAKGAVHAINSAGCPNFCRHHFFVFCYFESVNDGNKKSNFY